MFDSQYARATYRMRVNRKKRFGRNHAYINPINMNTNPKELYLSTDDLDQFVANNVMFDRINTGQQTELHELALICTHKDWIKFMRKTFKNFQIIEFSPYKGMIVDHENKSYLSYENSSSSIKLKIYGNEDQITNFTKACIEKFEPVQSYIEWMYAGDGSSMNIPLRGDKLPISEMYPFLDGEQLHEYYDRFMESSSSILLLIGPPGTGKTSFIRGLLQHTKASALVTYDTAILEKDYVFARFVESEEQLMVLEDADAFLMSRTEGNTMMHKFLNVGDGLITPKGKKMIFSTNLPSTKDIDKALIRPGRCFDILHFDDLTQEQAAKAAEALGIKLTEQKDKWSVADIFHKQSNTYEAKSPMGFL